MVEKADYDYTPRPSAVAASSLCMIDAKGRGSYTPESPLFIDTHSTTCASLNGGDIRLTPLGSLAAGTEVLNSDMDAGKELTGPIPNFVRYVETGEGGFGIDTKDIVYLDLVDLPGLRVDVGDLRMTRVAGYKPGSRVMAGDADANQPLANLGAGISVGSANVLYKAGSTFYINADGGAIGTADITVEERDIRLLAKTPLSLAMDFKPKVLNIETDLARYDAGSSITAKAEVQNGGKNPGFGLLITRVNGQMVDAQMTPFLNPAAKTTITVRAYLPLTGSMAALEVGDAIKMLTIVNGTAPAAAELDALLARLVKIERELADPQASNASGALDESIKVQDAGVTAKSPGASPIWLALLVGAAVVMGRRQR